jgi:hypothetical protein
VPDAEYTLHAEAVLLCPPSLQCVSVVFFSFCASGDWGTGDWGIAVCGAHLLESWEMYVASLSARLTAHLSSPGFTLSSILVSSVLLFLLFFSFRPWIFFWPHPGVIQFYISNIFMLLMLWCTSRSLSFGPARHSLHCAQLDPIDFTVLAQQ